MIWGCVLNAMQCCFAFNFFVARLAVPCQVSVEVGFPEYERFAYLLVSEFAGTGEFVNSAAILGTDVFDGLVDVQSAVLCFNFVENCL